MTEKKQNTKQELPDFIDYRSKKFDEFKQKRLDEVKDKIGQPIVVTLPDGSKKEGKAYETTPFDIASSISNGLAQNSVVSKVNGNLWDMGRHLIEDCSLELLKYDAPEAKEVFWHSSSHVLGEALELAYGCLLCKGPPMEDGGFYYEAYMDQKKVQEHDYENIEKFVNKVTKEKQKFERLELNKQEALELFKYNKFKVEILTEKVPEDGICTVYRCGTLIDPCRGPHLIHTGRVKAFSVTKNSSSYWRADSKKEVLQRVYGISFPDKKLLKEWQDFQEMAKQRDHRVIGKNQDLWMFHHYAPGMVFFLPHGQRIFNSLQDLLKNEYRKRGYQEVQTPNLFHQDLWKTSGHWDKYSENMFNLKVDDATHSLKPMNCPSHCLIFGAKQRSYRELPLRIADFGVLHRNELKGALSGMTRVRRFQQDDAHIFCRGDQIEEEIRGCLEFMKSIYGIFGFKFSLTLSTRPEKHLGEVEQWNKAEEQLKVALESFGEKWSINEGDGAFYGPKIDILIEDALKREHQCATIQLDFQLPIRFQLSYADESSKDKEDRLSRPVMIHRAILGSFERFIAILTEHIGGKWPFWLSPRQIIILPVTSKLNEYADKVNDMLWNLGYYVEVDKTNNKINKKVRNAQLAQYNYMLVVGQKELENESVNVRVRDNTKPLGEKSLEELKVFLADLKKNFK